MRYTLVLVILVGLTSAGYTAVQSLPKPICCAKNEVKKYKVTLSKDSAGANRTVFIDARDSSEARKIAKEQNPGWDVEMVTEVK